MKNKARIILIGIILSIIGLAFFTNSNVYAETDVKTFSYTGSIDPIEFENGKYEVTLRDVTIDATDKGKPAITINPGADVTIKLEGNNTLKGGSGFAGIAVLPEYENGVAWSKSLSAKLTIDGTGNLEAIGGNGDLTKGNFGGAAGIGGNGQTKGDAPDVDFGTIIVANSFRGTINAVGGKGAKNTFGAGAGIGTGGLNMSNYGWGEVFGDIEINNGTIVAKSNGTGAGIGSGSAVGYGTAESSVNIKITNGNVKATGGQRGAGIGGGSTVDGGIITITGGKVDAQSGEADGALSGAGIGAGDDGSVKQITITGGEITARATAGGAGIGGGANTSNSEIYGNETYPERSEDKIGKISISGKNTIVNAYGGTGNGSSGTFGGAGIGAGYPTGNNDRSVAFDIQITNNAKVNAYGGYHSQAIGYGYRPKTDGTFYTGYGINLTLDDTVELLAINQDKFRPALPLRFGGNEKLANYSSNSKYLVNYMGDGSEDSSAITSDDTHTTATLDTLGDDTSASWKLENGMLNFVVGGSDIAVEFENGTVKGSFAMIISGAKIAVTYNVVGDDESSTTDVINKGEVYTAKKLNKKGYKLDGFYLDEACTQKFVDGTKLEESVNLYYRWVKDTDSVEGANDDENSKTNGEDNKESESEDESSKNESKENENPDRGATENSIKTGDKIMAYIVSFCVATMVFYIAKNRKKSITKGKH